MGVLEARELGGWGNRMLRWAASTRCARSGQAGGILRFAQMSHSVASGRIGLGSICIGARGEKRQVAKEPGSHAEEGAVERWVRFARAREIVARCGFLWRGGRLDCDDMLVRAVAVGGAVGSFRTDGSWGALAGFGARWQVSAWGRVVGLSMRIFGPPCFWRWCAHGTTFAHRAGGNVGFSRDFGGFIFSF
jgi:hypothetical protein